MFPKLFLSRDRFCLLLTVPAEYDPSTLTIDDGNESLQIRSRTPSHLIAFRLRHVLRDSSLYYSVRKSLLLDLILTNKSSSHPHILICLTLISILFSSLHLGLVRNLFVLSFRTQFCENYFSMP